MKKLLFVFATLCCTTVFAQSKEVKQVPVNQVFDLDAQNEVETTNTAIYQDKSYKVYATSKGKLFIQLVSKKTGKQYRKYIKTEGASL